MPKKQRADARLADIQERFAQRINELWEAHETEFMTVLEDAESRKVRVTFAATLDFSESTAKLQTGISFSQVVKDHKDDDFDDPNQTKLPGVDEVAKATGKDGKPKPAVKRGRKPKREASDSFEKNETAVAE
jgi:hypothetical protein